MSNGLVPTKRFWWAVAAGIPLALLGLLDPNAVLALIPYNLLLLAALIVSGRTVSTTAKLEIHRSASNILSTHRDNPVQLRVTNQSGRELKLSLRDEPPKNCTATGNEADFELAPGASKTLSYHVKPFERGRTEFRGTFVRVVDPLGLVSVQRQYDNTTPVRAFPDIMAVRELGLLNQRGRVGLTGIRREKRRGIGTEFESLRDYQLGDDVRYIDWKSSARRGKTVVRNFERERNQSVFICVDVGRHMLTEVNGVRKLDHALDGALMLMHAAEFAGDKVGVMLFNDVIHEFMAPRSGRNQVRAALDAIYDAQPEPVQPNYSAAFSYLTSKWKRRSLIVLFTDAENEDQGREIVEALAPIVRRHLIYVVRIADPRLRELQNLPFQDSRDLYLRASTEWYLRERLNAQRALTASGVHGLESEPEGLSTALVNAYLDVKERALI
jgi:uncharacterized protein (DUF58 family)